MTDLVPVPNEVLHDWLSSAALRAIDRAYAALATRWRRPATDQFEEEVRKAIGTQSLDTLTPGLDVTRLGALFGSPEITGIVERLVAVRVSAPSRASGDLPDLSKLPEDVRALIEAQREQHDVQLQVLRRETARLAELWFDRAELTEDTVDAIFAAATAAGETAAVIIRRAAQSDARVYRELARWLDALEPRLPVLEAVGSLASILKFEATLRSQVAASHSLLVAPHLEQERRPPLEEAYVEPRFLPLDPQPGEVVTAREVTAGIDRTVLLGHPGAGKSTFGRALCHEVATQYAGRRVAGRLLTPMFVQLRDHATRLEEISLASCLATVAETTYQVIPPEEAIPYLLTQGRLLIVLDGLDEVTNITDRRRVRDAIEAFCRSYPMVHVLVTVRSIRYDQAQLDKDVFRVITLGEFEDDQIVSYATRWFRMQADLARNEQDARTESFLRESKEQVADLRTNPLMLALLCEVYRGRGTLPTSRAGIYERCSDLLLRRWDAIRQIKVIDTYVGNYLERTLGELAYWIYQDASLARGVPERQLVTHTAEYIATTRTGHRGRARYVAQSFIDFCRERAWVLAQVGRDDGGQPLFGFVHRTFLEFFAARHLVENSRTPSELADRLSILPGHSTSVVPQLAVQLLDDSRTDGADELLNIVLNDDEPGLGLEFVVDALRYVTPRPKTTRRIAREIVLLYLQPTLEDVTPPDGDPYGEPDPVDLLQGLGRVAEANILLTAEGLSEGLSHAVRATDRDDALSVLRRGIAHQPAYLVAAWEPALHRLRQGGSFSGA